MSLVCFSRRSNDWNAVYGVFVIQPQFQQAQKVRMKVREKLYKNYSLPECRWFFIVAESSYKEQRGLFNIFYKVYLHLDLFSRQN